ncbi:MAG: twin-arginine translocase TatA/TatE family subunit [Eggerthellaceae bacterium]|nr:twin-arginine translocase TatA/TatE family subunit [Eggerthellaceae bacterium]
MPVFAIGPVGVAAIAGVVATAIVGPDKLPELGYKVGRIIGELRQPIVKTDEKGRARSAAESRSEAAGIAASAVSAHASSGEARGQNEPA